MSPDDLREWYAFYTIEQSAQDPEITKWDSDQMNGRKVTREAGRKKGQG